MGLFGAFSQPASYSKKKHYKFIKTLGAGTYGVVRSAKHDKWGQVAVKIIEKRTVKDHEDMVYDEISMLQGLDHPHIIHFKEWFESTTKFYVTTTLATGGELFDRICLLGKFTEKDAVKLVAQVLGAVNYLHERKIVHRDLKPENLLYMTEEADSELVVADFGIAKQITDTDFLNTMAGSYGYAAPEILRRTGHSYPADLWSLGVITYTLLCGYSPFRAEDRDELIAETCRADVIFHDRYWSSISKEAKQFIKKLLDPKPEKRMTAKAALADIWITGKTATNSDLLPAVKAGFNARKKFLKAIEMVRLHNRLQALHVSDTEDDPAETPAVVVSPDATASPVTSHTATKIKSHASLDSTASKDSAASPSSLLSPASTPAAEAASSSTPTLRPGQTRKFRSNSSVFAEVVKAKLREAELEKSDPAAAAPPSSATSTAKKA